MILLWIAPKIDASEVDELDSLILCGGFATRLEPITLFVPKPLLPIAGKPIIDHILDSVVAAGAEDIVLSTNRKFADQFSYWMSNKRASGFTHKMEIVVEPTMTDGEKFGAIKGINYAIDNARLDDDLLIIAGDNYFSFDLRKLLELFNRARTPVIAVHDIKSRRGATRFGVVEMDGERITGFEEKPAHPRSTLISTGIYIFPKQMLAKFREYVSDGNNPDAPGYFLQWLISTEKIRGVVYDENWYDIGTVDTYKEVFNQYNCTDVISTK